MSGTYGSGSSKLNGPTDIYIDKNNVTYVLDAGNTRVQRVFSNSTVGTTVIKTSEGSALNQTSSSK